MTINDDHDNNDDIDDDRQPAQGRLWWSCSLLRCWSTFEDNAAVIIPWSMSDFKKCMQNVDSDI